MFDEFLVNFGKIHEITLKGHIWSVISLDFRLDTKPKIQIFEWTLIFREDFSRQNALRPSWRCIDRSGSNSIIFPFFAAISNIFP